jgi:hypothetical protein
MKRPLWSILVLLLGLLITLLSCGDDSSATTAETDDTNNLGLHDTDSSEGKPIQSMNIGGDYFRQEEAADAKYRGRVINIQGMVTDIGQTAEGVPYIGMSGMGWLLVQCIFPNDWTGEAPDIPKAQIATLKGKVEGLKENVRVGERQFVDSAGVRLTLSDCSIVGD